MLKITMKTGEVYYTDIIKPLNNCSIFFYTLNPIGKKIAADAGQILTIEPATVTFS